MDLLPAGRVARFATLAAAFTASALGAAGCHSPERTQSDLDAFPAPTRAPVVASPPSAPSAPNVRYGPCRVLDVKGQSTVQIPGSGGKSPLTERLGAGAWVEMQSSGGFVVKQSQTGREIRFSGAGRARPCPWADAEVWLARGMAEATGTSGEAPGSEQWIVTPYGVVRYGSAEFNLVVDPEGMNLKMTRGTAYVDLTVQAPVRVVPVWDDPNAKAAEADAAALQVDGGAYRIDAPKSFGFRWKGDVGAKTTPLKAAVDACVTHAEAARAVAESLKGHRGEPAFGDLAAQHVDARRKARTFCAVASLRIDQPPQKDDGGAADPVLLKALEGADRAWRDL